MLPDSVCRPAWSAICCLVHLGLQSPHRSDFQVSCIPGYQRSHCSDQDLSCCVLLLCKFSTSKLWMSEPRSPSFRQAMLGITATLASEKCRCCIRLLVPIVHMHHQKSSSLQYMSCTNESDRLWHSFGNSA